MKIKIKMFLIGTLAIMILTPTVWYGLQFYWQNKTKALYNEAQNNYLKKYAYTTIRGSLDQTMYADNKENGKKLLNYYKQISEYYKKVELGEIKQVKCYFSLTGDSVYDASVIIPIPIKYLGVPQTVYTAKDGEMDSLLKVYVFNTKCWGYFEAYVPRFNLHDTLPTDSLLQDLMKHINSLPKQADDIYGRPSPYGFYCN